MDGCASWAGRRRLGDTDAIVLPPTLTRPPAGSVHVPSQQTKRHAHAFIELTPHPQYGPVH